MLLKRKSIEKEESLRPSALPVKKEERRRIQYAPVTLSEQGGVRYLHFGTEWIQGAMRLRKPNWLELEYSRKMMSWLLFREQPRMICQLGLGAGALTKCHSMFALPDEDERLHIVEMDAMDFVNDERNAGVFDVLHSDLYDATARGPVLDTPEFYAACKRCLVPGGMMTVNLFGDHPSFARNISAMSRVFEKVICLSPTPEGNVIAMAFTILPETDYDTLKLRAADIREKTGLPAKKWLKDIRRALAL